MSSLDDHLNSQLNACSSEQLNKYLDDDDSLDILIKSWPQYQSLLTEKENLQAQNKRIAQENINKEPILDSVKTRLLQALKDFDIAKSEYTAKREAQKSLQSSNGGDMSLETIYSLLLSSSSKAEEETDRMADDFFNNYLGTHTDEELSIFQKQFIELRTQAHIKKIKAEKMKELMETNGSY